MSPKRGLETPAEHCHCDSIFYTLRIIIWIGEIAPMRIFLSAGIGAQNRRKAGMNAKFKPDMTRTPLSEWDDDRLMAEIGRGNQHAAHILIHRHLSYVLKICTARLGNGQDGEDAAQDVFASVWKNAAHWQSGQAKVTTWLYRIAVNRCIDIMRKRRPKSGLDEVAEPEDDTENAEALMQAADRNRVIRIAMAELSDDQQRAIELVYYREIRQREAAEMMGISLAALESVLRRGRQRLHEKLAALRADLQAV